MDFATRHHLENAAIAIGSSRLYAHDKPLEVAIRLSMAIASLRHALATANRFDRHLRSSIMRALNYARAALRNLSN